MLSPFGSEACFASHPIVEPVAYLAPAEELAAIGETWVERRRTEYLQGRAAAAQALRALGRPGPVRRAESGAPLWPEGVVGAITHTRSRVAAAVALRSRLLGIGIDLEPADRRVTPEVSRLVCTPREREWVDLDAPVGSEERPGLRLKLVFSAKESIFKATYPHAQVHLNYHDAELTLEAGALSGVLLRAAGPGLPEGTRLRIGYRIVELGAQPEASGPEQSGSYLLTHLTIPGSPATSSA